MTSAKLLPAIQSRQLSMLLADAEEELLRKQAEIKKATSIPLLQKPQLQIVDTAEIKSLAFRGLLDAVITKASLVATAGKQFTDNVPERLINPGQTIA